jgi:hypothetical protein
VVNDTVRWLDNEFRPMPAGPWRRQIGVAAAEDEHAVYLTNDAGDSLILDADDAAKVVNALQAAPRCTGLGYEAHSWDSTGSPSYCRDCGLSFPKFATFANGAAK